MENSDALSGNQSAGHRRLLDRRKLLGAAGAAGAGTLAGVTLTATPAAAGQGNCNPIVGTWATTTQFEGGELAGQIHYGFLVPHADEQRTMSVYGPSTSVSVGNWESLSNGRYRLTFIEYVHVAIPVSGQPGRTFPAVVAVVRPQITVRLAGSNALALESMVTEIRKYDPATGEMEGPNVISNMAKFSASRVTAAWRPPAKLKPRI